jgi:hypothetical protein
METASTSRRIFLNRSLLTTAGLVTAQAAKAAPFQATAAQSAVNLSAEKIVQLSLVVQDVEKVARRFSEVFGVSWKFYDLRPQQIILHDETRKDAGVYLKAAVGSFGGRSFKLIQPVSGPSSYSEFLRRNGEGFYTLGLGTLANHDQAVNALKKAGVAIEMQGDLAGSRFTILETAADLGCRIEFSSQGGGTYEAGLRQTGTFVPVGAAAIDMDWPVFSGGKKFNQIGIVVGDEKKAAKRFEELLGIGGWGYSFGPPGLASASLNEKPVSAPEMPSLDVAFANSRLGDLQLEIIRPVGIRPGGCHQWFFDKRGNGVQHLSFGMQADYGSVVGALKRAGIGSEFSATLKAAGSASGVSVTYFAMQSQLGGFQLEMAGRM